MGYTTEFEGVFVLDKPLTSEHATYLLAFSQTRRMQRDATVTAKRSDAARECVGLPVGADGGYFVGEGGSFGQGRGDGILDYNRPPAGQPGLWCKWAPTEDLAGIAWDGCEKFYDYVDWLQYLIENFLRPWGYTLSGEVAYQGEDPDDFGKIVVDDNTVTLKPGRRVYAD